MKMDKDTLRQMAREFVNSTHAEAWHHVTSTLRNCIIDAEIMDRVRWAYSADSEKPFTPGEIVEFRAAFVALLEAGIPRGKSGRIYFKIHD